MKCCTLADWYVKIHVQFNTNKLTLCFCSVWSTRGWVQCVRIFIFWRTIHLNVGEVEVLTAAMWKGTTSDGNFDDNLFWLLRFLTRGQSATRLTDPDGSHGNAAAWLKTCSSVCVSTRPFIPLQQEDQVKETLSFTGGDIITVFSTNHKHLISAA